MDSQRDAPVYNIKAVARMTGVPADTLRRWEGRYHVISPRRTGSGYRLYSQLDVDTINWLKARVEEGLSISRACEMLGRMGGVPAPVQTSSAASLTLPRTPEPRTGLRSAEALQDDLLAAFRSVDEIRAAEIMSEALALYNVEEVCLQVLQPVLVQVGEGWLNGEVTVAVEHFASSFARARLENLFHTSPHNEYGPLALVGCAPGELHELGAMFLSIFLRRSGYRVVYLGQNVPVDSLMAMVHTLHPDAVCVSATRAETASTLYQLRDMLDDMQKREGKAPLLAYGGRVFNRYPHITERLGGVYLGEDARLAVRKLGESLTPGRRFS